MYERPDWLNYAAAVLIQVALTAFLIWLYPYLPLGKFPAPYAAALLFTVLLLGEGPALLALVLSLLSFHYYFVPPLYSWALPQSLEDWSAVVAYLLVNGTVVVAVGMVQRSRLRAERLAASLQEHARLLQKSEAHKREFYKQTIRAATNGKLIITDRDEIDRFAGEPVREWRLSSLEDVSKARVEATAAARQAGIDESRIYDLMACVVESSGNAAKHAASGRASLHVLGDKLVFVVKDAGPGIGAMQLPDVALTRGYTTAGTLGMGYKVMISFADRVYLATDEQGTTVALELALSPVSESEAVPPVNA